MSDFSNYNPDEARRQYDVFYQKSDFKKLTRNDEDVIKVITELLPISADASVIDLPCGTGKNTFFLKKHYPKVIGVDLSSEGVKRAKVAFPNCTFEVGDALNLRFVDESLDLIYCSGLSVFNDADEDALSEFTAQMFKKLKKDGLFVFIKTTSQTDRWSKSGSRLDYTLASFMRILTRRVDVKVLRSVTSVPQAFTIIGRLAISTLVSTGFSFLGRIAKLPVRAYIILQKQ